MNRALAVSLSTRVFELPAPNSNAVVGDPPSVTRVAPPISRRLLPLARAAYSMMALLGTRRQPLCLLATALVPGLEPVAISIYSFPVAAKAALDTGGVGGGLAT